MAPLLAVIGSASVLSQPGRTLATGAQPAVSFGAKTQPLQTRVPCYRYQPPSGQPGKSPSPGFVRECKRAVAQLPEEVQEFLACNRFRYLFCHFNGDITPDQKLQGAYAFTSVPGNRMVVVAQTFLDPVSGRRRNTLQALASEGIGLPNVIRHETGHALDHLLGRDDGLAMLSQDGRLQALEMCEYMAAPSEVRQQIETVYKPWEFSERFAEVIGAMLGGGRFPPQMMLKTYPRLSQYIQEALARHHVRLPLPQNV